MFVKAACLVFGTHCRIAVALWLCLASFVHAAFGEQWSIRPDLEQSFVIGWERVGLRDDSPTLFRIAATVNGVYNSSLDIFSEESEQSGVLELPSGWAGRKWAAHDREVHLLGGHVILFKCPSDNSPHSATFTADVGVLSHRCEQVAERHFAVLMYRFSTQTRNIPIQLHIPFTGAREDVLAALPATLSPAQSNMVLDFVRTTTENILQLHVLPDDALVLEVFGGDSGVQHAQETLCFETIPDLAGLAEEVKAQPWYPFGVSYAQKIGQLVMAASAFGLPLCVETGSFNGETAVTLAAVCDTVFTIELSTELAAQVRQTLTWAASKYGRDITLLVGDSAAALWDARIQQDARAGLFYLDGHCSGPATAQRDAEQHAEFGSPVLEELAAVFARGNEGDVVVIDDASDFFLDRQEAAARGYPSILDIYGVVCRLAPSRRVQIKDGSIRIFQHAAPASLPNACSNFGGYHGHVQYTVSGERCPLPASPPFPPSI